MFNIQEALKDVANEFKYLQDTSVDAIEIDLLWENASPTSAFASQTIALDLNEYFGVFVVPYFATNWQVISEYIFCTKGNAARIELVAGGRYRDLNVSDTGVYFTNATTTSTDNNQVIPYQIYGIKSTAASVISGGAGSGGAGMSYDVITEAEIDNICDTVTDEMGIIPIATEEGLGCVSVGDGLTIDSTGKLSAVAGIGSAGMKLLWENPDTTVAFAAQTIELDLSGYDRIEIVSRLGIGSQRYHSESFNVGSDGELATVLNGTNTISLSTATRTVHSTETGVTFDDVLIKVGLTGSPTTNNDYEIPYQIYAVDVAPPNVDYTLTEEKDVQELLWTNPNPTASFAAQTIDLDLSEYDAVEIVYKVDNGVTAEQQSMIAIVGNTCRLDIIGQSSGKPFVARRNATINSTSIAFTADYYVTTTTSDWVSATNHIIPIEIYGIKNKINVTTAVVTDKGQHTDLLWENAVPSAGFAAQTLELDLSDYDAVEIAYYGQIAGSLSLNFYGLKSEICLKNEYSSLDSIAFIGASNTSGYAFTRNLQVLDTGIIFDSGYSGYTDGSSGASSTKAGVPCKIYGIKFNAATTSTIMGDYIVEQGTDGIWAYRKWASGYCEMEGQKEVTISSTTSWGSLYYGAAIGRVDLPFTLTEVYLSTADIRWNQGWSGYAGTPTEPSLTQSENVYPISVRSISSYNCWVNYQVKGRWK